MDLSFVKSCIGRVIERRRTLLLFGALFLVGVILGLCFIKTPAVYDYHLNVCERFLGRVCFSDRDVFVIIIERTAGCTLLLSIILLSGIHFVGLILPPAVLLYRAYTFGGSIAIFFSVYRMTGVLVVLVLYLPIHLLIDVILLGGTVISCGRAPTFCFCKQNFIELAMDLCALFLLILLVCTLEGVLLLAVFHPIGAVL